MRDDPIHIRRSTRLRSYDYRTPGSYFVTICTDQREPILARIIGWSSRLTIVGRAVAHELEATSLHRPFVTLDSWIIMPDHLHALFHISSGGTSGLAEVVRGFKSASTRAANLIRGKPGRRLWQRNYYERVVRGQEDVERIRQYIASNPSRWRVRSSR